MNTLSATSNSKNSSRGHICAQVFVTDKGFAYVVPIKTESRVLQAIKQFTKAIGDSDTLIYDAARA